MKAARGGAAWSLSAHHALLLNASLCLACLACSAHPQRARTEPSTEPSTERATEASRAESTGADQGLQAGGLTPCPTSLTLAELKALGPQLGAEPPQERSADQGADWVSPQLYLILNERGALSWWWSRAPRAGAESLPPPLYLEGSERCDVRYAWEPTGTALWALTSASYRPHPKAVSAKPLTTSRSADSVSPRLMTVIAQCDPCPEQAMRRPEGRALSLHAERYAQLKRIKSVTQLSTHLGQQSSGQNSSGSTDGDRRDWVAVRLRSSPNEALELMETLSRSCRCR